MRKVIFAAMVLLPCSAVAATECWTVDYPDHVEAICLGDADQAPAASLKSGQNQTPSGILTPEALEAAMTTDAAASPETELPDVPPEQVVRNGLARAHGESVLRNPIRGRW